MVLGYHEVKFDLWHPQKCNNMIKLITQKGIGPRKTLQLESALKQLEKKMSTLYLLTD